MCHLERKYLGQDAQELKVHHKLLLKANLKTQNPHLHFMGLHQQTAPEIPHIMREMNQLVTEKHCSFGSLHRPRFQ